MLPNYHVYNVGTAGHSLEICANYFDNACRYFSPKYSIIELGQLGLSKSSMEAVISGTYKDPELLSQKSSLARMIRNCIPASGKLIF